MQPKIGIVDLSALTGSINWSMQSIHMSVDVPIQSI